MLGSLPVHQTTAQPKESEGIMTLALGQEAPAFALKDRSGAVNNLKDVKADFTVVYFYPKDNTPGCTMEAQEFDGKLSQFEKAGAAIIGISGGNEESKEKFCSKHSLHLTLLSDPDFAVCSAYGVYGIKKSAGITTEGIKRTTFVLDKNKHVIKVFDNVKPAIHATEVLDFIRNGK